MGVKDRSTQRYTPNGDREVAVALILAQPVAGEWALVFVTSRNHASKLTLPKGGWESFESVEEAARREAIEESGAHCIRCASLEAWEHQEFINSGKQSRCLLHVVPLLFERFEDTWLEQAERKRFLIPVEQITNGNSTLNIENEEFTIKKEFVDVVRQHFKNDVFLALLKTLKT
ncbi:NUDIX hydrolase-like, putative [Bodo saltans]|uniref:NUDIX hydrolase-like, putative n=1 Tax=Bodo saltans TaxID=75058 RepID=A0A0S4J3C1_BODSA|nr:NUDIX hydrolase-like, putative [Bodo saltans]|eukprot:CUG30782.1 NUDIX hydrolase-like, putative [Bodo saltans]